MVNKYAGTCSCGRAVPVGAGVVERATVGWRTFCLVCRPPKKEARRLAEDGTVTMPYDRDALSLLRALPGAKWLADTKQWKAAVDDQNLIRTLELAGKLGLEIAPGLLSRSASKAAEAVEAIPAHLQEVLYPFQQHGAVWLASKKRALLADDMGLGKSVQTLAVCADPSAAVVIVCPASLKYNWAVETRKWLGREAVVLSGRGSFRVPSPGEILITNYNILPQTAEDAAAFDLSGVTMVLDEATAVKNYKAKRTVAVHTLTKSCARVFALTGTPLLGKPFDLWGLLSAVHMNTEVFGSWMGFIRAFNGYKNSFGGWEFGNPSADVSEKMRRVMLRRTKEEVLPDLPSFTRKVISINGLSKSLASSMDALLDEHNDLLERGELPPFEKMSKVRAALAEARIPAMLEIVESYEEAGTPLVVFSAYRKPVDTLGLREGWAVITGDVPAIERQRIVESFQAGKLKGIGLTIAAGGTGLTLTHASHMLFVDKDWTPAMNWQAGDRCRRIGQKASSILLTELVSTHPLDLRIQEILATKEDLIRRAIETEVSYDGAAAAQSQQTLYETQMALYEKALDAPLGTPVTYAKGTGHQAWQTQKAAQYQATLFVRHDLKTKVFSTEEKNSITAAYDFLLGVCDGAHEKDFAGFNQPDARVARVFRPELEQNPSDALFTAARALLSKYHRQTGVLPTGSDA